MLIAYGKMWVNGLNIKGRTSRKDYWYAWLLNAIIMIILMILDSPLGLNFIGKEDDIFSIGYNITPQGTLSFIYSIITIIPMFTLTIRRLHDINKSGWYSLIGIIPFIGWIFLLIELSLKTVDQNNKYDIVNKKAKNHNNKFMFIIILLLICTVSLLSYIFINKQDSTIEKNNRDNFYNAENLVENNYLDKLSFRKKVKNESCTYAEIKNNQLYIAEDLETCHIGSSVDLVLAEGINETPTGIFLSLSDTNKVILLVLTDKGHLYVPNKTDCNGGADSSDDGSCTVGAGIKIKGGFVKATNKKIVNIYNYSNSYTTGISYTLNTINELKKQNSSPIGNFDLFVETEDGVLYKIDDNSKMTDYTIDEYIPYPDSIPVIDNDDINMQLLISSDKNLYIVKNRDDEIRDYNLFKMIKYNIISIFDKSKKDYIKIEELKYNDSSIVVKDAFVYQKTAYVIDANNTLYYIEPGINELTKYDKKIKDYKINLTENYDSGVEASVIIKYKDNSVDKFTNYLNDDRIVELSTLSFRNHNKLLKSVEKSNEN